MIRFIHTSDLHLGKRFGNLEGDLPSLLRKARLDVIARLAGHAREWGADAILLAGDTFDSETPAPEVRRHALAEMRDHPSLRWIILPGNHDSLQAAQLWASLRSEAPENVILAVEPRPLALAPGAVILPSPPTTRRPGRDPTLWMDGEQTGDGVIRVGLAHGAIRSFSEESAASDVIAPDRALRAGLDYLALGDWHGPVEVDARTRYSGTPEPDRFKHDRPGEALLVELAGPGATPAITPLATGTFAWRTLDLHLLEGDDAEAALEALLPTPSSRRRTLARVVASGRGRISAPGVLEAAADRAEPDFAYLDVDASALAIDCEAADLDRIDRAGALREAADALLAEAGDEARAATERDMARSALARLFSFAEATRA